MFISELIRIFAIVNVALLMGCASNSKYDSPIRFSLEELGSSISDRNGAQNIGYRTSINISGISIPQVTGQIITVPGDNLPDLLASPVSTTCSKIIETKYVSDATYSDVNTIAAVIDELNIIYLKKTVNQIKKIAIASASETADNKLRSLALNILDVEQADETELAKISVLLDLEYKKLAAEEQTKFEELTRLNNKKNVIVTNWEKVIKANGGLTLGTIFTGTKKLEEKRNGFLIMADMRTSTLVSGDDLAIRIGRDKKSGRTGSDSIFSDTYITIFSLGAKHIAYSEAIDASDYLGTSLNITSDQLKLLLKKDVKAFFDQQSISLSAAIARALRAANRGVITNPTRKVYEYRFWGDTVMSQANLAELKRMDSYTSIYSNRGSIDEITLNSHANERSTRLSSCMHVIPKNQPSVDFTNQGNVGYEFCLPKGWNESSKLESIGKASAGSWAPDNNACIDLTKPVN